MYRLLPQQKSACEAIWRGIERGEHPLGLTADLLPDNLLEARYHVATTVRLLPYTALHLIVEPEVQAHGPLREWHKFEWCERDMMAPRSRPTTPQVPRAPTPHPDAPPDKGARHA